MGDTPSPPPTPDPSAVADKQAAYNMQAGTASQLGSMVNQVTPYGNLNFSQTGTGPNGVPIYTASTTLTPGQQSIVDALTGARGSAASQAKSVISNANYGNQNPADAVGGMTSGITKDILGKETEYLNPFFTQQSDRLDAQLRNQGLSPGTPAYDVAMNNLRQNQNQSVTGFLAQAEPAAYQQATSQYNLPISTAANLETIGQPTSPTFQSTPALNVQPPNFIGAQANADQIAQANYQNQMSQHNNMMSGLFGIPTAMLGGWAGSPAGGAALTGMMAAI